MIVYYKTLFGYVSMYKVDWDACAPEGKRPELLNPNEPDDDFLVWLKAQPEFSGKKLVNKSWIDDEKLKLTVATEQLNEARSAKITEIGDAAQSFVDGLIKDTAPEFERATYPAQQDDALAWLADNAAKTPTLDAIAKARGVPVEILRKKAADKVVAYRALAASVVGQRQAFEDKLNAAKTLADVEAIVPVYKIG